MSIPLDFEALMQDAAVARATLWRQHCQHAPDKRKAARELFGVLILQAEAVLEAYYNGDKERAQERLRLMYTGDKHWLEG